MHFGHNLFNIGLNSLFNLNMIFFFPLLIFFLSCLYFHALHLMNSSKKKISKKKSRSTLKARDSSCLHAIYLFPDRLKYKYRIWLEYLMRKHATNKKKINGKKFHFTQQMCVCANRVYFTFFCSLLQLLAQKQFLLCQYDCDLRWELSSSYSQFIRIFSLCCALNMLRLLKRSTYFPNIRDFHRQWFWLEIYIC